MNEQIKNYLGGAAIVGVLAFSYAAVSYVRTYSQAIEPSSFRSFSVTADAKVVAVPDVATFAFAVITEGGTNVTALQSTNVEKTNTIIAYVKSQGVDGKDIKTESYSVEPREQYYGCETGPCPPPVIVGYTVRQSVSVKVRDFAKAGDILGGVIENGANSISSLNFTIDDPTAVENEARAEAIAKAKEKARAIAKAGDFSVGRLLSIDEGGGVFPQPRYLEAYGRGGADDEKSTPSIEPGSQDVTVTVTLRYEIR